MDVTDIVQAIAGAPLQTDRLLRVTTPLGADTLVAERLDGRESVDDGGYRLELTVLSADAHVDPGALLGAPILVELLTDASLTERRPFHGHATAVECVGSNGGLARYRLIIEPWLAFLRYRRDSYVYRDATVIDIVEQVLGHYTDGVAAPHWRWQLENTDRYVRRSLTTQYEETDFDFLLRLLAEEGIWHYVEHEGDANGQTLGQHTLVLADSNRAFGPSDAAVFRYHRRDATEGADAIQAWHPTRRWQAGAVTRASWDHRTLSMRPAHADAEAPAAPAVDEDTAGPYAWVDGRQGDVRARQHLDARHVASEQITGGGSVRALAPGLRFCLSQHPTQPADAELACLQVTHHARNNFGEEVASAIEQTLGGLFGGGADDAASTDAEAADTATDFYHNTFTALPVRRIYRPHTQDGHGLRRQPGPSASGSQSAIVVGNGDPVHTDRDHRVIVQQHFQRGGNGASSLTHPRHADAPADATAGTWARVATPLAGANWGSVMTPRVGQEVWLDYLEGDIDRPVVVASLYNGEGNADAPHNQRAGGPSGASGNAPAWFTGNGHAGVLSGIKSQDLASSTSGAGGYRQLRLDDTPAQGHAQLATTDYASALTLGHVKQLDANARETNLGYGAHLATAASGALRAGAGLYLAADRARSQMDAAAPIGVLDRTRQQAESLNQAAVGAEAGLPAEDSPLTATDAQNELGEQLAATAEGRPAGGGIGGGEGEAVAWAQPHLLTHGADGLAAVTPESAVWVAGTDTVVTTGADINLTAGRELSLVAAEGLALYTQGQAGSGPVATTGIALHAATGPARLQAQQDTMALRAAKAVTVASTGGSVDAAAKGKLSLTAGNSTITLSGSDITLETSGKAEFKAAQKQLTGGASASAPDLTLASGEAGACEFAAGAASADGSATMGAG